MSKNPIAKGQFLPEVASSGHYIRLILHAREVEGIKDPILI